MGHTQLLWTNCTRSHHTQLCDMSQHIQLYIYPTSLWPLQPTHLTWYLLCWHTAKCTCTCFSCWYKKHKLQNQQVFLITLHLALLRAAAEEYLQKLLQRQSWKSSPLMHSFLLAMRKLNYLLWQNFSFFLRSYDTGEGSWCLLLIHRST